MANGGSTRFGAGPRFSVEVVPLGTWNPLKRGLQAVRSSGLAAMRRSGTNSDGLSDEALLAGMAVGDEHAGIAFVRRYQRRVFGLALNIVGDPSTAEDVAHEALVRAWRHTGDFDCRRASVATWLLTITRNLAIDALRARCRGPTVPADLLRPDLWSTQRWSTQREPGDAALISTSIGKVKAALNDLPAEQRRAVLRAAMYGRMAVEIANAESIPLGTASSRIRIGMARLRESLAVEELS
jgi:RNA polymerase sigma factor (sigma-70 family)